jgi:hypothetical protein
MLAISNAIVQNIQFFTHEIEGKILNVKKVLQCYNFDPNNHFFSFTAMQGNHISVNGIGDKK